MKKLQLLFLVNKTPGIQQANKKKKGTLINKILFKNPGCQDPQKKGHSLEELRVLKRVLLKNTSTNYQQLINFYTIHTSIRCIFLI